VATHRHGVLGAERLIRRTLSGPFGTG